MERIPSQPWAMSARAVSDALGVECGRGLSDEQARARRKRYGSNRLVRQRRRGALRVLLDQFTSLITLLLAGAAALGFAFGDPEEGSAILAVILFNAGLGFATEWHALRSMEALRVLGQVPAVIRRDGQHRRVNAEELVPGDVLLLEAGDVVPADARILECARLQADESLLTGESQPVDKTASVLAPDTHLFERSNMMYRGSALVRGAAEAIVTGTGSGTELGDIAALTGSAGSEPSPLDRTLRRLGRLLVMLTGLVCGLVAVAGVAAGRDLVLTLETAIALAVAAIPEGLPIVATIALARGMWRMARNNALIERLTAVATLGATSLIIADKTGTLTANRMRVRRLLTADGEYRPGRGPPPPTALNLLEAAALCNTAELAPGTQLAGALGDPTELALLESARDAGLDIDRIREAAPSLHLVPFDSDSKMMAWIRQRQAGPVIYVKGAPEHVLDACTRVASQDGARPLTPALRQEWLEQAETLGRAGLRSLAVASRPAEQADAHPYRDLVLLGIAGLADPPREGISGDMQACHRAGIRVVMVTGDQLATATAIAEEVGLCPPGHTCSVLDARHLAGTDTAQRERLMNADVISRASPRLKLELISMQQAAGLIVAMTGDGVNDAPALKKADIGIAMGKRGTQVAREAAAMVLEDDEFSTIIKAIAQGRAIYANIRKFVIYLLSCNLSEILVIGLATLSGAAPPLLPLQILFLNMVTDVFPALALGMCGAETGIMQRPPRPAAQPLITRRHWRQIVTHAGVISAAVLASLACVPLLAGDDPGSRTSVAFLVLALAQLLHVFNMRAHASPVLVNEVTRNPWVWVAILLCLAIIAAALAIPALRELLGLGLPSPPLWALICLASLLPVALGPLAARTGRHGDQGDA